jgi:hypothetical protein
MSYFEELKRTKSKKFLLITLGFMKEMLYEKIPE